MAKQQVAFTGALFLTFALVVGTNLYFAVTQGRAAAGLDAEAAVVTHTSRWVRRVAPAGRAPAADELFADELVWDDRAVGKKDVKAVGDEGLSVGAVGLAGASPKSSSV